MILSAKLSICLCGVDSNEIALHDWQRNNGMGYDIIKQEVNISHLTILR